MCLILFAQHAHSDYPLVFAGNRDELYDRPTAPATFWDDAPHVLGGRDLKAGGTWLGVTRHGYWATITNVRDQMSHRENAPSRGLLVADYLSEEPEPGAYLESVQARADRYNGFNLIVGTPQRTCYFSNRDGTPREVDPGIHGMSNAQLDDPWPKVERGTARLRAILDGEVTPAHLLDVLADRAPAPDDQLPDTGVDIETERMLSPPFIEGDEYGTRASTVILLHWSGTLTFVERIFESGTPTNTNRYVFEVVSASSS
jgi:uncharacterized protein with NRDE domain